MMGAYGCTVTIFPPLRGNGYYTTSTCSFRFPILFPDGRFSSRNPTSSEMIGLWPAVSPSKFSEIAAFPLSSLRLGTMKSSSGGGERLDS